MDLRLVTPSVERSCGRSGASIVIWEDPHDPGSTLDILIEAFLLFGASIRCQLARAFNADRHGNLLISINHAGSKSHADQHTIALAIISRSISA